MDKQNLRQQLRARRGSAAQAQPDAVQKLLAPFKTIILPPSAIVAGYAAIHDEIDPKAILSWLTEKNYLLALPALVTDDAILAFREYHIGDELESGAFQIPHPHSDQPLVTPDILLVPLLGFDRAGNRIGYGKGYYDRILARLRKQRDITAIGLAYAEQEVDQINAQPHDQRLNIIVTPQETIYCPAL